MTTESIEVWGASSIRKEIRDAGPAVPQNTTHLPNFVHRPTNTPSHNHEQTYHVLADDTLYLYAIKIGDSREWEIMGVGLDYERMGKL